MDPRAIIEDIRLKLGVGIEAEQRVADAFAELQENLTDALDGLARDLYSKESHFVLELIQNAEDNKYDTSEDPFIRFVVFPDRIIVQNNEIGFAEANVRAICRVGRSTKVEKGLYIGEKGIGFKSVFKVSDEPHVFSNGFRFKFMHRDSDNKLGFILPVWVETAPHYVAEGLTTFVLPLKDNVRSLFEQLVTLDPAILLFLTTLKRIEISSHIDGRASIAFSRTQVCQNTRIDHGTTASHYRLVRRSVLVPETVREEKREKVKDREVVLAFPITSEGAYLASPNQQVFAFLPVRQVGFPFIVQTDFLLLSNREDLHKDLAWNSWLRDEVGKAFLEAVQEFKADPILKHAFYGYIPLEKQVTDDFFLPVVLSIHQALRQSECMLIEGDDDCWLTPSSTCFVGKELDGLLDESQLRELTGCRRISESVKAPQDVLTALGVRLFGVKEFLSALPQQAEWLKRQPNEWMRSLYAFLGRQPLTDGEWKDLSVLELIRLQNQETVNASNEGVFFPLDPGGLFGFEQELPIVHREMLPGEDNPLHVPIKECLSKLGVTNSSPQKVVVAHILPRCKKNPAESMRLAYALYVKDRLGWLNLDAQVKPDGPSLLEQLRSDLLLFCRKGGRLPEANGEWKKPCQAYLPDEYGNTYKIEPVLDDLPDVWFVDRKHLQHEEERKITSPGEVQQMNMGGPAGWKDFFLRLGVESAFRPPEIVSVMSSGNAIKIHELFSIVDAEWSRCKRLFVIEESVPRQGNSPQRVQSTAPSVTPLCSRLRLLACVPTAGGLARPESVYLDKPAISQVLRARGRYLDARLNDSPFAQALGVRSEPDVAGALECLRSLGSEQSADKAHFEALYRFLSEHFAGNEQKIRAEFRDNALLLFEWPTPAHRRSGEVFWKDASKVFGRARGYAEKDYPDLRHFFVGQLQVPESPRPQDLADRLLDLGRTHSPGDQSGEVALVIYEELGKHLRTEGDRKGIAGEPWWPGFIQGGVYWTDKDCFRPRGRDLFLNDDADLWEVFRGDPDFAVLGVPEDRLSKVRYFLKAVALPSLSAAVGVEVLNPEEGRPDSQLTNELRMLGPYLARHLYHTNPEGYERLKERNVWSSLRGLEVEFMPELRVLYTLNGIAKEGCRPAILGSQSKLYLAEAARGDLFALSEELAKLLGIRKGLSILIYSLLRNSTPAERERLMKLEGAHELPPEEQHNWDKYPASAVTLTRKDGPESLITTVPVSEDRIAEDAGPGNVRVVEGADNSAHAIVGGSGQTGVLEAAAQPCWHPSSPPSAVDLRWETYTPASITNSSDHDFAMLQGGPPTEPVPLAFSEPSPSLSHADRIEVGRWGEMYVMRILGQMFRDRFPECRWVEDTEYGPIEGIDGDRSRVKVVWKNRDADTGWGYDIEVQEDGLVWYVEVKSTPGAIKDWFEVTGPQWDFAVAHGDRFWIYRVYEAGTPDARVVTLQNPVRLWKDGSIQAQPLGLLISLGLGTTAS